MKKIFSISLLFIFLVQCQVNTIILAVFYLERSYVTETFCENKNKPEIECDGKCYLKKQLDKEEEREAKLPMFSKDKSEVLFVEELSDLSCQGHSNEVKHNTGYLLKPYYALMPSPFHPPPFTFA